MMALVCPYCGGDEFTEEQRRTCQQPCTFHRDELGVNVDYDSFEWDDDVDVKGWQCDNCAYLFDGMTLDVFQALLVDAADDVHPVLINATVEPWVTAVDWPCDTWVARATRDIDGVFVYHMFDDQWSAVRAHAHLYTASQASLNGLRSMWAINKQAADERAQARATSNDNKETEDD